MKQFKDIKQIILNVFIQVQEKLSQQYLKSQKK